MDLKRYETESLVVDERRFPLVYCHFRAAPTEASVELYLSRADLALGTGRRYAIVIEASRLRDLSAAHRDRFARWIAENEDTIARLCVGQSYVLDSILQRMVIRSVFMVSPLPVEHVVVPNRGAAVSWAIERLRAAGESIPVAPDGWG